MNQSEQESVTGSRAAALGSHTNQGINFVNLFSYVAKAAE